MMIYTGEIAKHWTALFWYLATSLFSFVQKFVLSFWRDPKRADQIRNDQNVASKRKETLELFLSSYLQKQSHKNS